MIRPANEGIEVWLCVEHVDFRKQITGLATLVQDPMAMDPFSAQLFVFSAPCKGASSQRVRIPPGNCRSPSRLASLPSLGTTTAWTFFAPPVPDDYPRAWTTSTAAPAPPHHSEEDETSQVPGRPLRTAL